jgi:flagellar protein FlaG
MLSNTISSQATSMSNTKVSEIPSINKTQAIGGQGQSSTSPDSNQDHPSKKEVEALVNSLNEFVKPHQTSIQFKLHDKLNEYYVQVIDDNTKSVIKEIPSKQLLDAYSTMMEHVGLMFDKKI